MKPLILITGATATGKTRMSVDLCQFLRDHHYPSEIINFDSLIFYRELNIGSAKPTKEELSFVPHHLIDTHSITEPVNASDYVHTAKKIIDQLHQQHIVPILVGGSAFYIRALIKGMYDSPSTPPQVKKQIEQMRQELGYQGLRDYLKKVDEDSWHHIHANDDYRTVRALEHFLTQGTPLSAQRKVTQQNKPYDFTVAQDKSWGVLNFYLEIPTGQHWPLIQRRTELMIERGLIEEVQNIMATLDSLDCPPLQSIGYKETIRHLQEDPSYQTKEQLVEAIYIATRQLAKSQKTFFKKITPKVSLNPLESIQETYREQSLTFLKGW